PIGSITATPIRSGARYSTATATTRTSSSRSTASGSSRSEEFTTKVALSGPTKVEAIPPGSSLAIRGGTVKRAALRWYSTLFGSVRAAQPTRSLPFGEVPVGEAVEDGYVDVIATHADGTIAVLGWSKSLETFHRALSLTVAGVRLGPATVFRVHRPDLAAVFGREATFFGAAVEWIASPRNTEETATLQAGGR